MLPKLPDSMKWGYAMKLMVCECDGTNWYYDDICRIYEQIFLLFWQFFLRIEQNDKATSFIVVKC